MRNQESDYVLWPKDVSIEKQCVCNLHALALKKRLLNAI